MAERIRTISVIEENVNKARGYLSDARKSDKQSSLVDSVLVAHRRVCQARGLISKLPEGITNEGVSALLDALEADIKGRLLVAIKAK